MKIKIPPYPNYKIADSAFRSDILAHSVVRTDSSDLKSNQLILTAEFKNGEKRVMRCRPIRHKTNLYVTSFPNPVHLFLDLAIEQYNNSEIIKDTNFPQCGKKQADDVYLLDIEENGTHACYNQYMKFRIGSIIMLVSSIEAFLNHIIPNDFVYNARRGDKIKQYDKTEIESNKVWFEDKLINVIPLCLNKTTFWDNLEKQREVILELYENRKNIIHLKTNAADDLTRYFDVIDKMLDFDILSAINATCQFMNAASDKFVEFEND